MSLFGALNSATAGLRVFQANVKVVTDNVTQADNPNRTRHQLERTTDRTGRVVFATYSRQVEEALELRVRDATSKDGGDALRNTYLTRISDMFGMAQGQPNLTTIAEKFAAAWRQLETTPESDTAQREVIQLGDRYAHEVRRLSEGVEQLDNELRQETFTAVDELNKSLAELHQLNADIVYVRSKGEPSQDLEDRRDGVIRRVAEYVEVRTLDRGDGRVAVFTTSGLSLVDANAVKLSYDGTNMTVTGDTRPLLPHMRDGKLGALLEMRADGSLSNPPLPPSDRPTSELIRKLRSQLDGLAGAFTGPTRPGEPKSFADAYNEAGPTEPGEVQVRFFSGTDRLSIAISHELITGTGKIKQAAVKDVAAAMNVTGRTFQADGLMVSETTYTGVATGIVGLWSHTAKTVQETSQLSLETKSLLITRHHNEVGVNIDEEMTQLQALQTSYSATARVVQAINAMFDALERAV